MSNEDFVEFALPAARRALSFVVDTPTMYFTRDSSAFLNHLPDVGATGIALDWRTDMARARKALGGIPVQGNLDPIALQAPDESIRKKVRDIIKAAGPVGHVFNLGHGCVPSTPISGIHTVLDEVQKWSWET